MEIKNTTPYTYDCLMEFNRQHQRKLMTILTVIICICAGLMVIATVAGAILTAVLDGEPLTVADYTTPALYVLLAVFLLVWPPLRRKKVCRKQADVHTTVEYVFTADNFLEKSTSDTVNEQSECKYAVVTKVTESEHAFYLYISPLAAHIVSKNGFTEGTENDFRMLLRTVIEPQKLHIR